MLKQLQLKWKNIEIKNKFQILIKSDYLFYLEFEICFLEFLYYICNPINNWRRGRAARLGSAKAPTPVRIRTMPQKPSRKLGGFFLIHFLEK